MALLDYAKSAVERFVKRVRDRRYQHHFMLLTCGRDSRVKGKNSSDASPYNGRNLRATDLSDVGAALRQALIETATLSVVLRGTRMCPYVFSSQTPRHFRVQMVLFKTR
ncbi:hypothetical protein PsorP6_000159 [Peronosclerospora sorghi]|uniref:Uncharacterized protein n=1 Tax=Peronosclerospora sorghi TaxID=230839 RepID=A0ACC0WU90_9STRA|nr:hypothetical protein PsorP6_000159 [Peronosclerospora sorghi]